MDFTPREKSPVNSMIKKNKSKIGVDKKKATIGFDEDEDDPNFDEFLADFEKNKKDKNDASMTE